jgi:hypothetical protein
MNALERRRDRLDDGRIGHDGASFVPRRHSRFGIGDAVLGYGILSGADLARREELDPRDAPRSPIDDDVNATERLATRERLDNPDPVDLMCEPAVRVTRGDDVHQPMRQASRNLKDL